MKLLVLNLNASDDMTALIERTARQVASPGTVLRDGLHRRAEDRRGSAPCRAYASPALIVFQKSARV